MLGTYQMLSNHREIVSGLQTPLHCSAHTESSSIAACVLLGSAVQEMLLQQRRNFIDVSNIDSGGSGRGERWGRRNFILMTDL